MIKRMFLLAAAILAFLPSSLFGYSVYLYSVAGAPAEVQIDIEGDGSSEIDFNVQVLNPAYADLRSVFFNFSPFQEAPPIKVVGEDVTSWSFINTGAELDSPSANLNGVDQLFLAGIEIGLEGIGKNKGDIYSTNFTIYFNEITTYLGSEFGARLTSVGDSADSRELSSKLVSVPESSAVFTLFIGIGLIGFAKFYGDRTRFKRV